MSLRVRLTLAFVLVVLAPLLIAALLVGNSVPNLNGRLSKSNIEATTQLVVQALTQRCTLTQSLAHTLAWESIATSPQTAVRDSVAEGPAIFAAILAPDGSLAASAGRLPHGAPTDPAALNGCHAGASSTPYAMVARVPLTSASGADEGISIVALPLDVRSLIGSLSGNVGVTLLAGTTVVSSTLHSGAAEIAGTVPSLTTGHPTVVNSQVIDVAAPRPGQPVTVVVNGAAVNPHNLEQLLAAVVVAAVVLAIAVGWVLSRMTTRPLIDLARAADRVAQGDLATRIPVETHDEVGQLAVAFNDMTDDLRTSLDQLRRSRDQLRGQLARLGETLSSTHDLNRILTVITETATTSVSADGGVLLMGSGSAGELYVKVARNLPGLEAGARVPMGHGALGVVASGGGAVNGYVDASGVLLDQPAADARAFLGIPLTRSGRVLGVLGLYRPPGATAFDSGDVETIRTFGGQATVAIDNVLLHQEAQRLSITDGLTGLWNYRYFTMNFAKEIERAARFGRPLALLLLDLDRFKRVNDEHGHQRGDSVLIELATRVSAEIREVDTLARYGGEEFVLVLPETDAEGARQAAERICEVVRHRPFGHEHELPLAITVSVGVAVFPAHGSTAAALIRSADTALYVAKEHGRNQWRMAEAVEATAASGA